MDFQLKTKFKPSGSQPDAIKQLVSGLNKGYEHQTLLGVTGSGKTFTVANVIERVQKPTLVIAHNKTLAAQLTNEFRELFPDNAVHYFVSYYDYYQPEAYLPTTDTYIGKEALINDEIDKLRHAATTALLTRRDVIVVASVSCIYGLGTPDVYEARIMPFKVGDTIDRKKLVRRLIENQFTRTSADLKRGTFRLRGDNWEIMPPYEEKIYNFVLKGDRITMIYAIDPVRGFQKGLTPKVQVVYISPARHFMTPKEDMERALVAIKEELAERLKQFEKEKKYLEAERLERRTKADMAMMREVGYCNGIENYSRHLTGRNAGDPPNTLLDYFPTKRGSLQIKADTADEYGRGSSQTKSISANQRVNQRESAQSKSPDFLTVIDESHVTVPQIRGMYEGDASRKRTLVLHGFRLPSAVDNRPLRFPEFQKRVGQVIYTSATPGEYELKKSGVRVDPRGVRVSPHLIEQIIRPTGLVDPKVTIRPARGQVDDLLPRVTERVKRKERVLITTLTKRMAEDLADYMHEQKYQVAYLHSDIKTLERIKILTALRKGAFDVLVGVNLLREGLDLPEVSLVAILDADKEGFLRSETSLIQTIGRAARNVRGEVLIYADNITGSIKKAVSETERRRNIQLAYNKKHNITPKTIVREIRDIVPVEDILDLEVRPIPKSKKELDRLVREKEREMKEAAGRLEFELAAILRDEVELLKKGKKSKFTKPSETTKKKIAS